ncbi:MAG: FadR/GntR family transcriptional regulator [Eubacteriales bacterium]
MARKSRKQQFIMAIEEKILSGEWKVGDKIPTERELVEEFETSRTVVNAALAELQQIGFLDINPRQWTKVADYKKDGKLETLYSQVRYSGGAVDANVLQGILDARRLVEDESTRLAAKNATDADIEELYEIVKLEESAKTLEEKTALDFRFHHMLCVASGNPVYPLILNSFHPIGQKFLQLFYSIIDDKYQIYKRHLKIVDAIKSRDGDAAAAQLDVLLVEGEQIILKYGGMQNE